MDTNSLYPILYRIEYPHATLYVVAICVYDWTQEDTRWMANEQYPEDGTLTVGVDLVIEEEYFESLGCARDYIRDWWETH